MNGYVSLKSARKEYGVILNPKTMKVDKRKPIAQGCAKKKAKRFETDNHQKQEKIVSAHKVVLPSFRA